MLLPMKHNTVKDFITKKILSNTVTYILENYFYLYYIYLHIDTYMFIRKEILLFCYCADYQILTCYWTVTGLLPVVTELMKAIHGIDITEF